MALRLFPASVTADTSASTALPLYRDVLWQDGRPVYRGGSPVLATGLDALRGWIWRALMTARYDWPIHSRRYGCELEQLAGRPYTAAVKTSEAQRMVRDALEVNPYITGVQRVRVSFDETTLSITAEVKTVYGEAIVNV